MNPFRYGKIVSGEFFYDRTSELKRIKDTLKGGNNLVLYAPRRYGKSSLVLKILKEFEKEGFKTIYLDFMSIYSREVFIRNYSKLIAENDKSSIELTVKKIGKLIRGIVPSLSFDSLGNPSFSFSWIDGSQKNDTLEDIIDLPEKLSSSKNKWIIAFDEFQEITKLNGESFEKLLRTFIQNHKNVTYLFLGSRTHLLKDMFSNKSRAFYNSAMLMNLDVISTEESIKYLKNRFAQDKLNISEKVAAYLVNKVDSIPYYIQFIAAEIWQQIINNKVKITTDHIDEAIKTIIQLKSDYYWELTNKQTSYRKKVLVALSHSSSEMFSKETANKYDLGASSTTQKAIRSFIEDGIIEQFKDRYKYSDPFYKMFIRENL